MKIPTLARALFICAGLGLAGCATVGPDYVMPQLKAPAAWRQLDDKGATQSTSAENYDLGSWWLTLRDPLLSELIEKAVTASPDLRSAEAKLRESRARNAVAGSDRFPTVTGSGSAARNRSSAKSGSGATTSLFSAGFDASWELDIFGGTRRGMEAAGADLEASLATLQGAQVTLAAEVAQNYLELRTLQKRIAIARDNLASQSETLQLTEWRAQAGLVATQDVEQARSNREQTRAAIPTLEASLTEAEHRLDVLLGEAPGTLHGRLSAVKDLPLLPDQVAVGIPAETLRQRPDLRAAERKLAAETARVGVAEAARYPSFTLSGSIGLEALTLGGVAGGSAAKSSLLGSVTAPVFDAGTLRSRVEIQDAVREQAQIAYQQSLLTALQEVENALVTLSRRQQRGEALQSAALSARNAAELARQRYGAGLIDFRSVVDTERNVLGVEDSLAETRGETAQALVALYKALGGGWRREGESN
ncbi:efflux transporter outer membrane subunit [Geomonas sp. Red69]|uniref:efflux transporter outer membrane subunit n=1 Tax=Geomonas diazotrophica TaxID=2843197 RepID=UPI001C11419F|nr:efflux transporter outer membrane subunit [Geomonas diazotrophica]MBU5637265.1 efflux transporter outer membrane subunit [Geomonas diazotrophica]